MYSRLSPAALVFAFSSFPCAAGTVMLTPTRDNTIYESSLGDTSNGAGEYLFAGSNNRGSPRRALLLFDLSSIPAGSTIEGATLTMTMSRTISADVDVSLHRASAAWGEGASDAFFEEGGGAFAEPGDATWLHTFSASAFWASPGGDFAPVPSATTSIGLEGVYSWSSAGLIADVQAMLDIPGQNFGWMVIGSEIAGNAKRFGSRENADPASRPSLMIEFTPPASCEGDFDGSGAVNFADISFVLANWGNPFTFASVTTVLANWNNTCP